MDTYSIAADELYLSFEGTGETSWRISKPLPGEPNRYDIELLGITALESGQPSPATWPRCR